MKSVNIPESSEEAIYGDHGGSKPLQIRESTHLPILVLPKNPKKMNSSDELVAGDPPPRIPPGEYLAVCTDFKPFTSFRGMTKLVFSFTIYSGPYDKTKLAMFCTKPTNPKKMYRHKLFREWSVAIGRFPKKGERATKATFVNRLYRVQVILTKKKYEGGRLYPDHLQTSIVDHIIFAETGPLEKGSK